MARTPRAKGAADGSPQVDDNATDDQATDANAAGATDQPEGAASAEGNGPAGPQPEPSVTSANPPVSAPGTGSDAPQQGAADSTAGAAPTNSGDTAAAAAAQAGAGVETSASPDGTAAEKPPVPPAEGKTETDTETLSETVSDEDTDEDEDDAAGDLVSRGSFLDELHKLGRRLESEGKHAEFAAIEHIRNVASELKEAVIRGHHAADGAIADALRGIRDFL